jgi:hypothetical protein
VSTPLGPTTTDRPRASGPQRERSATAWYRRRSFLIPAGIVVVAAAMVVSDLPTHTSRASDIQAETTVIGEINADVAPCVFSMREALTMYADETSGTLSSGNRAQIPGLLRDDQNSCSYTESNVFDLSDIEVPGTAAGKQIGQAVNTVTLWATSDALGAIEAIQALTSNPADHRASAQLTADERLLAQDRSQTDTEIAAAGRDLSTTLPGIDLTTGAAGGASGS